MIGIRDRWPGSAHKFGLSSIGWPFHVTNNRDGKREQDQKLDDHRFAYSAPIDLAIE
jgi:hypothetical protein